MTNPITPPPPENIQPIDTAGPQFAEPSPTPDPTRFVVKHGSDKEAYSILDKEKGTLKPRPFPISPDVEPRMSLADAIGSKGQQVMSAIEKAGQIVFHAIGDTGNTSSAEDMNMVTDKLVSDFNETEPENVPSFCYNLGDVVYSFGEAKYYYDQFYDPYRDYPAPISAVRVITTEWLRPESPIRPCRRFLKLLHSRTAFPSHAGSRRPSSNCRSTTWSVLHTRS